MNTKENVDNTAGRNNAMSYFVFLRVPSHPSCSKISWLLTQCSGQFRHRLEQIGDQAVVGDLENRRLGVLVDGDDDLAVLHAGQMLDGTRNADREIQLG